MSASASACAWSSSAGTVAQTASTAFCSRNGRAHRWDDANGGAKARDPRDRPPCRVPWHGSSRSLGVARARVASRTRAHRRPPAPRQG